MQAVRVGQLRWISLLHRYHILEFTLAIGLVSIAVWLTFVGYLDSDDVLYSQGANGWLINIPYLGQDHWSIRHGIVLPMALGFKLLGESELTLILPSFIYTMIFIILLGYIASQLFGWKAACLTIAISGTTPVVATAASVVATDLPEAVFVIGSVWTWHQARCNKRRQTMFFSGVLAGLALITRETSIALLIFYAFAFAADSIQTRKRYIDLMFGILIIVGIDWLYLFSLSGDPLYRLHTALKGVQGDGPQLEKASDTASGVDRFGSLTLPSWLRPIGAVLLNQNYGLCFWFALPTSLIYARCSAGNSKNSVNFILYFCAAWWFICSYILSKWLWIIPRYYAVCVFLVVPFACFLSRSIIQKPVMVSVIVVLVLAQNILLDLGSTVELMAGERGLVKVVQTHPGIIHTDPSTARGASWLLARDGLTARVSTALPVAGDLYYANSRPRRSLPNFWPLKSIPANWIVLETKRYREKWTGSVMKILGGLNYLPLGLREKLDPVPLQTTLYVVQ